MGLITRSPHLQFSRLDGEFYAVDSAAGRYIALNETAGRIWQLLEQPHTVETLVQRLRQEFDVSEQSCRAAVVRTVRDLEAVGAVAAQDVQGA